MPGRFDTLNLTTRELQAQQAGVQALGQNLANLNNPAYARQSSGSAGAQREQGDRFFGEPAKTVRELRD